MLISIHFLARVLGVPRQGLRVVSTGLRADPKTLGNVRARRGTTREAQAHGAQLSATARHQGAPGARCWPILGHRANPAGTAPTDHRQRTPVGPWIPDPGRIGLQTDRMYSGCYLRGIINPDCLIAIKIRNPAQPFIEFQYLNIPG